MICTDFKFFTFYWDEMRHHYKIKHPEVKRPDKYFTKEARSK